MNTSLMIDNWTLQDVEGVLSSGLGTKVVGHICISEDRLSHSFSPLPEGVHQIDALLTLITNLVCFDELSIDSEFLYTWEKDDAQLLPLKNLNIVVPEDFRSFGEDLFFLRETLVRELCVTPTLEAEMAAVQAAWKDKRAQINPHLSALVWGGAGMLARSNLCAKPYFGHPFRRKLLQETRMFSKQLSAAEVVTTFLQEERSRMVRFRGKSISGSVAQISVPPIAVKVIEDIDNIEQLIPAALNIRDKHAELRSWIARYQQAIDEEDEGQQMKHEKVLRDISRSLQVQYGAMEGSTSGISLSASFFQLDLPKSLLDKVRNSFGVRSSLCKLVMAPRGVKALEKLLAMLGEGKSLLGRDILIALQARYSAEQT